MEMPLKALPPLLCCAPENDGKRRQEPNGSKLHRKRKRKRKGISCFRLEVVTFLVIYDPGRPVGGEAIGIIPTFSSSKIYFCFIFFFFSFLYNNKQEGGGLEKKKKKKAA